MQPTIYLYDEEPYQTEFTARVLSCEALPDASENEGEPEERYGVILDRTLFFPEQGGQTADRGELFPMTEKPMQAGIRVCDVRIRDGMISHEVEQALAVGSTVTGRIDWIHRFSHMQQHTGEHILSGLIHSRMGYDNVGFHLSDSVVTLDLNGSLTREECRELEDEANRVIYANLPVLIHYPTQEEEQSLEYRSKKEVEGRLRIVSIPGVDACACCAPHVRHTGEIGILKIMGMQKYKGGVRLQILCGSRALEAFRKKEEILDSFVQQLSASQNELPGRLAGLLKDKKELSYKIGELHRQMALRELFDMAATSKEENRNTPFLLFVEEMDAGAMRDVINAFLKEQERTCGIFSGTDELGYHYIIGSNCTDCRKIAERLRDELGAKGGGDARMIQGSVKGNASAVRTLLQF